MDGAEARAEAARLIALRRWLALATVDERGNPSVSYAPFAAVNGAFGLVTSRLASHAANLLACRPASVLLVDEGIASGDAYARARFSIAVTARPHAPGSAEAQALWAALQARQGSTVRILQTLPDFDAISLEPGRGRLIAGFASAHDLDAATIAELLRGSR
ncbi:MAG: pyridoxamine 5'-phosphate oxidase family protein [Vulcanimicrobiaceae bacterium]